MGEIYGRDRATGIGAGNADDDEEEVRQQDTMNVNLGVDSNMNAFEENFMENDMYYNQQPSVQQGQPSESSPSISTHKTKTKGKNKDKIFENMCSNIGSMAKSLAAIVQIRWSH